MDDKNYYEIRLFDRSLISFSAKSTSLGRLDIDDIVIVDDDQAYLYPAMLMPSVNKDTISSWLSSRVIPKNRAFVDKILKMFDLSSTDTLGIINICKGLSVTDSYWVVPQGFSGTWEQYNLFDNPLDETLALVAYTGYTSSQRHEQQLSSEWTTGGTFPKAWRRIDNKLYLFKAANPLNEHTANKDYSPYSEFFASQLEECFDLQHVQYGIQVWKEKTASVCKAFTNTDVSFVPYYHLSKTGSIESIVAHLLLVDKPLCLDSYFDMLVLDSFIANPDRHIGNWGFLRDNSSGLLQGFAPIFDNNMAFFPTDMANDYSDWSYKSDYLVLHGVSLTCKELLPFILTEKHHAWARKALEFSFDNEKNYPIDNARLDALSTLIQIRAKHVLSVPYQTEKEREKKWRSLTSSIQIADTEKHVWLSFTDAFADMPDPEVLRDAILDSINVPIEHEYEPKKRDTGRIAR